MDKEKTRAFPEIDGIRQAALARAGDLQAKRRRDNIVDYKMAMYYNHEDGLVKGRAEGRAEGRADTLRKLYSQGIISDSQMQAFLRTSI